MSQAARLTPGLMVIHGNRPEALSELVLAWCRRHPLPPLVNESVLVQSNGIAQWLKMAWARPPEAGGLGVCAAMAMSLPSLFLWRAYRAELGRAQVPEQSPLDKQALTWRLMRLLPRFVADGQSPSLSRFLGQDDQGRKRFQLAERLADLFDQYQVYRADWLGDWAAGRWVLQGASGQPGDARPLPEDQVWQARLWQAVLADVGEAGMHSSRASVHRRFLAHRQSGRAPVHAEDMPARVIVFGISSMPAQALEALAALASTVQVVLCVHNPSMHHWSDTRPERDLWRSAYRRNPSLPAPELALRVGEAGGHPLLSAWGRQGRDYVGLIDRHDEPEQYRDRFMLLNGGRIDVFEPPEPVHLLAQLQDDMLNLRPLHESRALWPPVDVTRDHSLRFHRAHSAQREVEVLHDQLLACLGRDATLAPRDIVVMVPDIEDYAPHIAAVFGRMAPGDARHIPHTILDQSERTRQPMLLALERFMALPEDRLRASEVLDWLDVPAVQARFGLAEGDAALAKRWIEGAGVRWGLNAAHRAELGFDQVGELNSWQFGLRRMLLGYATGGAGPDQVWQGVLPYDEVAGLTAAVLGPLTAFIAALAETTREWRSAATPEAWVTRLQALLTRFFAPSNEAERALIVQLGQLGDDWLAQCELAGFDEPLPATVVREAWQGLLDAPQLGRRFLSGGVSFCSLMPMRAIPFRLVCLLGMNDGDYPRQSVPAAFDLMQRDHRPGDRSRREDDRYLFLEAVLSARDALYVSWVGRDIRDNTEVAPSTLVGQLRDHVAAGWCLQGSGAVSPDPRCVENGDGKVLLKCLTADHPLQPFSAVYFEGPPGPAVASQASDVGTALLAGETSPPQRMPPSLDDEEDFGGDDFATADEWAEEADDGLRPGGAGRAVDAPATVLGTPGDPHGQARGGAPVSQAGPDAPEAALAAQPEVLPFEPERLPAVFTFASEWAPVALPPDWVLPGAPQAALPADAEPQRLDLAQLARFLANPVAAFFAQRLRVQPVDAAEAVRDDEAFALDGLAQWQLQAELIEPLQHAVDRWQDGADPASPLAPLLQAQQLAGKLPLHGFGEVAQTQLHASLGRLMARHAQAAQAWPQALDAVFALDWSRPATALKPAVSVQASLQGLRRAPDGGLAHIQLLPGRLHRGKQVKQHLLVRPWVQHLAWQLALADAGLPQGARSLIVSESGIWGLAPLAPDQADAAWQAIVEAWLHGMCQPLPVACSTALAWLDKRQALQTRGGEPVLARWPAPNAASAQALQAARQVYEGGFQLRGECDQSPSLKRSYPRFDDLLHEPDAFADWALRLYQPLLRHGQPWASNGQGDGGHGQGPGAGPDAGGSWSADEDAGHGSGQEGSGQDIDPALWERGEA